MKRGSVLVATAILVVVGASIVYGSAAVVGDAVAHHDADHDRGCSDNDRSRCDDAADDDGSDDDGSDDEASESDRGPAAGSNSPSHASNPSSASEAPPEHASNPPRSREDAPRSQEETPARTPEPAQSQEATETRTPTRSPTPTETVASFDVADTTLDDPRIRAGESVAVGARVRNVGERSGTFVARLEVDGRAVAAEDVSVDPDDVESVEFERQFDEPGEYEIAVGSTTVGTLTVIESDDGEARDADRVEIVDAELPADWVESGFDTTVRATVENAGEREVSRELVVTVDDEPVASETVTVPPNERVIASVEFEARDGTVAVNGVEAGAVRVSEAGGSAGALPGDVVGYSDPWPDRGPAVLLLITVVLVGGTIWALE